MCETVFDGRVFFILIGNLVLHKAYAACIREQNQSFNRLWEDGQTCFNGSRNALGVTGLIVDRVHFLTLVYPFYELDLPYRQPS